MSKVMWWSWVSCVVVRFCMIFSYGMIHPDEFFQSQEVMATSVFSLNHTFIPWEWNPENPNRSIVFPGLIAGLPYWIIKELIHTFKIQLSPSVMGKVLLYVPRILLFFVSLLFDISIVKVCKVLKIDFIGPLMTFATSWTAIIFLTRPFSNTAEALCLAASYIVLLLQKNKSREILLGAILAIGTFVRFTFILFFFPIGLYLVFDNDKNATSGAVKKNASVHKFRLTSLVKTLSNGLIGFLIAAVPCVIADTLYFNNGQLFVVPPLNNLRYNLNAENLAEHGIHPRYTHILANMQILFGPLPVVGIISAIVAYRRQQEFTIGKVFLSFSVLFPLALLSLAPHQEPRFILPLIFPMVLLVGNCVFGKRSFVILRTFWIVFNVILSVFYGVLHQGGVIPSLFKLSEDAFRTESVAAAAIYYHTYMPPRFLCPVNLRVIDLGGASVEKLDQTVSEETTNEQQLYMVYPATTTSISLNPLATIWPHVTTDEDKFPTSVNECALEIAKI